MLDIKNTVREIKNSFDGLIDSTNKTEQRIGELKNNYHPNKL